MVGQSVFDVRWRREPTIHVDDESVCIVRRDGVSVATSMINTRQRRAPAAQAAVITPR